MGCGYQSVDPYLYPWDPYPPTRAGCQTCADPYYCLKDVSFCLIEFLDGTMITKILDWLMLACMLLGISSQEVTYVFLK